MKIYVVTRGEYSNYRIEEVFLTKEKAKLYINAHRHDASYYYDEDYDIEEYDTFDDNIYEEKDKKVITLKYECGYGLGTHYNVEITNLPLINNSNKIIEGISIHTDYYDCRKISNLKLVKIINSDRVKTREQYIKILQDMVAETKNMLFEYDYVTKNNIGEVVTSIQKALEQKYL